MKAVSIEPRLQECFQHWQKNMVRYSLKAKLGQFYTNKDETAVLYEQGDLSPSPSLKACSADT